MTNVVRRRTWWMWAGIGFYHLLGRFVGSMHVTVEVDGYVYDASVFGFRLVRADHYPLVADRTVRLRVPSVGVEPEAWASCRFTTCRAALDTLGFPCLTGIRSCVTETARLLRISRRCRRPDDVFAAIMDEDYGHGVSSQRSEGQYP